MIEWCGHYTQQFVLVDSKQIYAQYRNNSPYTTHLNVTWTHIMNPITTALFTRMSHMDINYTYNHDQSVPFLLSLLHTTETSHQHVPLNTKVTAALLKWRCGIM